ncbi:hypothetical protein IMSAGC007_04369 [Lachnospiraceae bacterium]|mgnify:CR=1 FL=1|jgi:hypothetical protein|uniref:hypothetical protein n=1 Tax=Candidatus Merdisoma sp. JLR.KK011 TaxID=3114299 RepID=UPI001434C2C8|nr:hypothetical protein IMSAGC007_04369 [Lachnospiraceae bacterium]
MVDYFMELRNKLSNKDGNIEVIKSNVTECKMNYTFEFFEFGISDETKRIYNTYKEFLIYWKNSIQKLQGFINFVPYEELLKEHEAICEITDSMEDDLIEGQEKVINDLKNWYPIFKFPNGDAFCYDKRNGMIVFFEHDVFDVGINLNGLVIAKSIDFLLENWSKVLFVDIYDWYQGVNEEGIDINKPIYEKVIEMMINVK